jgi:hypothetical protein
MDHAEVRDRLADALLAPGGLDGLLVDDRPESAALRDHLGACPSCRAEADALATTGVLLAAAAPDDLAPSPETRGRVLAAVLETGRVRESRPSAEEVPAAPEAVSVRGPLVGRWTRWPRWVAPLAAAAAFVILAGGLLLLSNVAGQRDHLQQQRDALADVTAATGQILGTPDHDFLALQAADGSRGGSLLFSPSTGQLVVWSGSLAAAEPGERYDCYVIHDGQALPVGYMREAGQFAYWIGQVPPGTPLGSQGDRFLVVSGGPAAAPTLSGTF